MSSDRLISSDNQDAGATGMGDIGSSNPSQVTMNEEPILLALLQTYTVITVRHLKATIQRENILNDELHPTVCAHPAMFYLKLAFQLHLHIDISTFSQEIRFRVV